MPDTVDENTIEMVGNDYPFFRHVSGVRDGLDLRYIPVGPGQAFKAVLEYQPFQVNEFSLANYALMRDRGVNWMIAIPVFLNRAFRHGSLFVHRDSDLTHPSQLRGKTICARQFAFGRTCGICDMGACSRHNRSFKRKYAHEHPVFWRDYGHNREEKLEAFALQSGIGATAE